MSDKCSINAFEFADEIESLAEKKNVMSVGYTTKRTKNHTGKECDLLTLRYLFPRPDRDELKAKKNADLKKAEMKETIEKSIESAISEAISEAKTDSSTISADETSEKEG